MKKTILASALTLSMTPLAHADFIGLYLGAYGWDTEYKGYVQESSIDRVDFDDALALEDETNNVVYVAFEHPIPVLPNIKVMSTELKSSGSTNVGNTFGFGGTTFDPTQTAGSLDTDYDFSFTDATLYYEILDNIVSLDLGLTLRKLDGEIVIFGPDTGNVLQTETGDFDPTLPMIYAMVGADLPLTGLSLRAELNYLGFGGDETDGFMDLAAYINYEFAFGLGLMAGVRDFSFEYEDEDEGDAADFDAGGAFLGVSYHF